MSRKAEVRFNIQITDPAEIEEILRQTETLDAKLRNKIQELIEHPSMPQIFRAQLEVLSKEL